MLVKNRTSFADAVRLIRFAAVLWIGYLVLLAVIGQSFPWPQQINPLYNVALGCVAVLCLILSYWNWIQERLGKAFIPLIVAVITILPVLFTNMISRLLLTVPGPLGPRFTTPESLVLVVFPFLFVALMLVAWQYKWQYVLLVILGIAGLHFGMIWSFTEPGSPLFLGLLLGGLTVTLIQTIVFLAVGFSISYLMSRLNKQQQSLAEANSRLTHHASTLEHQDRSGRDDRRERIGPRRLPENFTRQPWDHHAARPAHIYTVWGFPGRTKFSRRRRPAARLVTADEPRWQWGRRSARRPIRGSWR